MAWCFGKFARPFPGWLARHNSNLELATTGKAHLLGLALKRLLSRMVFILKASQQLAAEGVLSLNEPRNRSLDDAEVDELLLMASQALESATEKAQTGTSKDRFSSLASSTKV